MDDQLVKRGPGVTNYVRQVSRELGITLAEARELMTDPEQFVESQLSRIKAAHVAGLDKVYKVMEARALKGDVKAAEWCVKFIDLRHEKHIPRGLGKSKSEQVDKAVKWLPGPTVDATVIPADSNETNDLPAK